MEIISSIYNSGYNIKKFYLGSRQLNLAYLGNQVIYDEVIGDNDLNYILYEFYGSDTLVNTVEAPVKSAILKGSTKYRNIDTGEILDAFDETKNLELVSVKMPVLTTTGKNLCGKMELGSLSVDTGLPESNSTRIRTIDYIPLHEPAYTISSEVSATIGVRYYDENKKLISSSAIDISQKPTSVTDTTGLATIPKNAKYLKNPCKN